MTQFHCFFLLGSLITQVFAVDPALLFVMTWSSTGFGPDGPWQAVQIDIGLPPQQVALYPGGSFRSHLFSPKMCTNLTLSRNYCFASEDGVYDVNNSSTSVVYVTDFEVATDFSHGGLQVYGSQAFGALDQIDIGMTEGSRDRIMVTNVTIAVYDDVAATYPGRSDIALQVGTLSLGYLGTVKQSFGTVGHLTSGSLIPGYLKAVDLIA